jgi:hypothetical protein
VEYEAELTPPMLSNGHVDSRGLTFPSEEYGGIEYGGLPVTCIIFVIMLCPATFRM